MPLVYCDQSIVDYDQPEGIVVPTTPLTEIGEHPVGSSIRAFAEELLLGGEIEETVHRLNAIHKLTGTNSRPSTARESSEPKEFNPAFI